MNTKAVAFLTCAVACLAPTSTAQQMPRATIATVAAAGAAPHVRTGAGAGVGLQALAAPLVSAVVESAAVAGVGMPALQLALQATSCALASGAIDAAPPTLTLIDYSRPSTEPRLWVFDLEHGALLFEEHVAHGAGSGENLPTAFSDTLNSHQSSLGLFVARDTYVGRNGYSLRLDGLEPGFNGRARERAIVMHGAPYVDAALARQQGRLGRSWGCPALREAIARDVIDTVQGGGVIFSYFPDQEWLDGSRFLNCGGESQGTVLRSSR